MKHQISPLFFLILLCSFTGGQRAISATPDAIAEGNTEFAVSLYGELSQEKGNVLFSPYSISTAMAMAYSGARANTAKEMEQALHFPVPQQQLPAAIKALTGDLQAAALKDGQKLVIANALCVTGGGAGTTKDYEALVKKEYDGAIFDGKLDDINGWVKKQTEGKIDKILTGLDPNTVCVLLDAVYFKGIWENKFNKNNTTDGPFQLGASKESTVPFMLQGGDFHMIEKESFQAISIPYRGGGFSMVIFLPAEAEGLGKLEKQLTGGKVKEWLAELDKSAPHEVVLRMPKYEMATNYDLIPACKALGIHDAFDANAADFGGIDGTGKSDHLSQVRHKAFLEVNEEGTVATAATAVEAAMKGEPPRFDADHPYLFLIRHEATGTILFMGRMADPKGE